MVNMRQRKLIVLEIKKNETQKIIDYISQNMYFIKNHCLAFDFKIDAKLRAFLRIKNLDYFCIKNYDIFKSKDSKVTESSNIFDKILESNTQDSKIIESKSPQDSKDSTQKLTQDSIKDSIKDSTQNSSQNENKPKPKKIKLSLDLENNKIITSVIESIESSTKNSKDSNNIESKIIESSNATQDYIMQDSMTQNCKESSQEDSINPNFLGNNVSSNNLANITFNRAIRNGEELTLNANATFLKNINSGAKIITQGNLQIYANCDGDIESFGDFIVLKKFNGTKIALKNLSLDEKRLSELKDSNLKILNAQNGIIEITDLS